MANKKESVIKPKMVKDCSIDFYYYERAAEFDVHGEVRFSDNMLIVSYELENGTHVVYQGTEKGKGHYELRAPIVNGKATLHMFDHSKILEGYWFEEDENWSGMWRIRLT